MRLYWIKVLIDIYICGGKFKTYNNYNFTLIFRERMRMKQSDETGAKGILHVEVKTYLTTPSNKYMCK